MARNKHPEETVGRILDVASRLFLEKDTSIPLFRISSTTWRTEQGGDLPSFLSQRRRSDCGNRQDDRRINHMWHRFGMLGLNGKTGGVDFLKPPSISLSKMTFSVAPDFQK